MSRIILNFKKWLKMTEKERRKEHLAWNVYDGEGQEIASKVLEKFKEEYGNIPKLKISDTIGIYHGGTWAIHVTHPFVFDRRKIPQTYLGIEVRGDALLKDIPKEFQVKDRENEYVWAPERYEKFVDRCADEIRKELGNLNMGKEEMLDALIGGDFKAHVKQCKKWEKDGLIPREIK